MPHLRFSADLDAIVDQLSCPAEPPQPVDEFVGTDIVVNQVRTYLMDGNVRLEINDWLPPAAHSPMKLEDDEVEAVPDTGAELACLIGDTTIVAFSRDRKVTRHYAAWTRDDGLGEAQTVTFRLELGFFAYFGPEGVTEVLVVNRGGIVEAA